MIPRRAVSLSPAICLLAVASCVHAFVPATSNNFAASLARSGSAAAFSSNPFAGGGVATGQVVSRGWSSAWSPSVLPKCRRSAGRSTARMAASDNNNAGQVANVGALGVGVGCAVAASAISEISLHAAAFVQLVCLSVWLGMSVYATFVWPIITGINMRDSSEFASLLGKLGPSYLQLSAAMIMSLGTSSVVIGHPNTVQLYILGVALGITLYNAIVLEPTALIALEEEQAVEQRMRRGQMKKSPEEDLPKMQAELANFLGAEVLLDLLSILCALSYAWDLASTITFA